MRLLTKFRKKPRAVEIANRLVLDVEGEGGERMVLVDGQQKEWAVALTKVELKGQEEAEAGGVQVESLVVTEVQGEVEVDTTVTWNYFIWSNC